MKTHPLSALLTAGLIAGAAMAQEYHSNDLTLAGSSSGKLNGNSGGRQCGSAMQASGYYHAVLLSGNALAVTDLNPAGYYYSQALCSDDVQQGGWGYSVLGTHALVWNGAADAYVDLHPGGYNFSYCLGVHAGEQVGYAQQQSYFVTASHAYSWHGSSASGVDLHPVGWTYAFSRAMGCHDGEEVGYVSSLAYPDGDSSGYHTTSHAVRWSGSAATALDIHPAGYVASEALCTTVTQQGGWGLVLNGAVYSQHAMIWSGSGETAVDLHPVGYTDSKVTALNGSHQVGEGWVGAQGGYTSVRHALVWSGTADSALDLNQYLPAGYTNGVATGVDADGNIVGYAYNGYHPTGLMIPAGAVAVVFAPGAPAATQLASIDIVPAIVAPGDTAQVSVSLGGAAPAGGVNIDFLSTATALVATPASVLIPEGESNVVFSVVAGGTTLTAPSTAKLYGTDGSVSRAAGLTIRPVVKLNTLTVNPIEGGFSTYGAVYLTIPAQVGGATVSLSSGNPSLAAVPATITVPQGYSALSFSVNTAPIAVATTVPISATYNGTTVTANLNLSPAPVVSLTSISAPEIVGGQSVPITITLNNFPRAASGAVIALQSGDTATLNVPASVTVPYGAFGTTITVPSAVVSGRKGVSVKATYNGSTVSTTVFVNPIPPVTITQADYVLDTKMLKVQATTPYTNSVLTYGGEAANGPFGTMQFEQGVWKGSIVLDTPPTTATVWSSVGGMASMAVTIKTATGGTATGGGGGGGGSTTGAFKLTLATSGKGTVTASPSAASYAPGTVVTLTATPAAGSPWVGWSGDATGTANPIKITINRDMKVTANFR
ncbi:MAG: hypothetical protein U1G08_13880 [Verrucomicrobiota bacterium]